MNDSKQKTNISSSEPYGLGGWMILFGWIPLVVGGTVSLLSVFYFLNPDSFLHTTVVKKFLPSPDTYFIVLYSGLVVNIVLFLFSVWTFIKKERKWVYINITWIAFSLVWGALMTTVFILSLPSDVEKVLGFSDYISTYQTLVTTIIIVAYLLKSKRVNNTFVN
jgi:hypothetical protein